MRIKSKSQISTFFETDPQMFSRFHNQEGEKKSVFLWKEGPSFLHNNEMVVSCSDVLYRLLYKKLICILLDLS